MNVPPYEYKQLQKIGPANLSVHEHVDEGVVGCAGLGKERGDDGHCGRHHALPAKGLDHGHGSVGCPTHQEAGNHQEKHGSDLLLVAQDPDDLNRLEVLDGAQLQETGESEDAIGKEISLLPTLLLVRIKVCCFLCAVPWQI